MSGFTPGPWTAHPPATKGRQWGIVKDGNYDPSIGARRRIALLGSPKSYDDGTANDEDRANAYLIAAAPTMAEYIKKRADAGDEEAAALWRLANGTA